MIKFERISVMNMENAIRGARNPMNSWDKIDSHACSLNMCDRCRYSNDIAKCDSIGTGNLVIGMNDMQLLQKLRRAGSDHRKYLRQIFVSVDITAPLYWWKEASTYRVGVTMNSTSTMHKIHSKKITVADFSIDEDMLSYFVDTIIECERLRALYIDTKEQKYWRALIQLLPCSYNQMRTVTMNYETLVNIYHARKNHKLKEWRLLCDWIKTLPYAKELIICEED